MPAPQCGIHMYFKASDLFSKMYKYDNQLHMAELHCTSRTLAACNILMEVLLKISNATEHVCSSSECIKYWMVTVISAIRSWNSAHLPKQPPSTDGR